MGTHDGLSKEHGKEKNNGKIKGPNNLILTNGKS